MTLTRVALAGGLAAATTARASEPLDPSTSSAVEKARQAGAVDRPNPFEGDPAAIAAGRSLFLVYCAVCHGGDARGGGPAAPGLDPRPVDFADPARWASTPVGAKQWIVLNGVEGTGMVASGLSPDDAWRVLAYLSTIDR